MAMRVLITDDHGVVRQGLRMFLSLDSAIVLVGEAENGEEAVAMARELNPDVVLMDLLMPVMDGIEATKTIRSELPDTEVIALTSVREDASVTGAVRAGGVGYLLEDTHAEALHRAIRGAAEGRVQLTPEAAARLMREVRGPESPEAFTEPTVNRLLFALNDLSSEFVADSHRGRASAPRGLWPLRRSVPWRRRTSWGRGPCRLSFRQTPLRCPRAQKGQPRGPGLPGPTAARAQHRKQHLRDHHGEPGRQRRASTLKELRGGVPPDVKVGDPLARQPFLDGDARRSLSSTATAWRPRTAPTSSWASLPPPLGWGERYPHAVTLSDGYHVVPPRGSLPVTSLGF